MGTIDDHIYGDPHRPQQQSYGISLTAILICLALSVLALIGGSDLSTGVYGFIMLLLYFIPAFLADALEHPNRAAIFALNLLLGWTGLGWIGALIWSLTRRAP